MYWANYISKGPSWRMPMDGRLLKGCTAHGKAWKIVEGTGSFWTCVIRVWAWMTELLYASCLLSCLIVVSLPYSDMWTLLIVTQSCLLLLTDHLLSITHYACNTLVEVLISHSKVAGSSPAWLLCFTTCIHRRSTRAYSRSPSPFPFQCGLPSFISWVDSILHHWCHYSATGLPHRPCHWLVQLGWTAIQPKSGRHSSGNITQQLKPTFLLSWEIK